MGPKSHAVDALDNIESMLDALLDDNAGAIAKPPTDAKTSKRPVKDTTKQHLQKAERGSNYLNGSRPQKTTKKQPRKGRARVKPSSPKPVIRKKVAKKNKDVNPSTQNVHNSTCENDGGDRSRHPSEDKDDLQFLRDLKRMAERKRQIEKRRHDTRNAQIAKKMKIIMGTTEERMRELVGSAAREVSMTAQGVKSLIPKDLDIKFGNLKKTVAEETKSLSDLKESMSTFSSTLQNHLKDLQAQVQANEVEYDAKIEGATKTIKKAHQKRRDFRRTLVQVEKILEKDRSPVPK